MKRNKRLTLLLPLSYSETTKYPRLMGESRGEVCSLGPCLRGVMLSRKKVVQSDL